MHDAVPACAACRCAEDVGHVVRRMLGVEQEPVVAGMRHHLDRHRAAQAAPQPDLQLPLGDGVLEGVARHVHECSLRCHRPRRRTIQNPYPRLYRIDMDARRKAGMTVVSATNELHRNPAELAEVAVQRVALLGEHHAGERARQHDMAGLHRRAERAELVGKPRHAHRRMAEHAGGDAGLLDLGVAVHDAADPAQIDVHRPHRPAAHDDAGGGAVVGHRVENLARVLHAGVDDLERRHHVVGRRQHVGQADARAHQLLAEHEGELDLDARPAIVGVLHLGAVRDDVVVVQIAEVRLVDVGGALHRLRGQPHLVADQLPPRRDPALVHHGRDRIGVLDGDARIGGRELHRLFAGLVRLHQDVGGLVAVGFGQHRYSLPLFRGRSCKAAARKAIPPYPGYAQPRRLLRLRIIISLPGRMT